MFTSFLGGLCTVSAPSVLEESLSDELLDDETLPVDRVDDESLEADEEDESVEGVALVEAVALVEDGVLEAFDPVDGDLGEGADASSDGALVVGVGEAARGGEAVARPAAFVGVSPFATAAQAVVEAAATTATPATTVVHLRLPGAMRLLMALFWEC